MKCLALDAMGVIFEAADVMFVDDRAKNIEAARALDFNCIEFDPAAGLDAIASRLLRPGC